jgi:HD-GYP domain-containing protein (c-di-GMP phosphodiesterase class II)
VGPADVAPHVDALLHELRRHDPATRAHAERVRRLSDRIAVHLGVDAHEREKLGVASVLHDVGKLAVPRHILNKPGEPTDAEWEVLHAHPDAADALLAPIRSWLGPWIGAATEHHERFDGSGYPRGLSGDEITLAGRIVAVADAYDCIVSIRSYKAAEPVEVARAQLAAGSGTQFDPEVVHALLAKPVDPPGPPPG